MLQGACFVNDDRSCRGRRRPLEVADPGFNRAGMSVETWDGLSAATVFILAIPSLEHLVQAVSSTPSNCLLVSQPSPARQPEATPHPSPP